MPKQEILPPQPPQPPQRNQVTRMDTQTGVPGVNMGNFIDRTFSVWSNNGQSRAIDALANRNRSEAGLFNDQTTNVRSAIALADALALARDTPERHEHELALRRLDREGALNQRIHDFQQAHRRHETEAYVAKADTLQAKAIYTRAEVVVVDAEQQLQAQREFGYLNHELRQRKIGLEIMDIQLGEEERLEYLRKFRASKGGKSTGTTMDAEALKEALHRKRQELNAKGMPTASVDAALEALEDL